MFYIWNVISFILLTSLLVYISKESFSKCLPLSFILNFILIFLFDYLFKNFMLVFIFNWIIDICFIIFLVFKIFNKSNLKWYRKLIFSDGLYIFLILSLFIFIYNFKDINLIKIMNLTRFSILLPFVMNNDKNSFKRIVKSIILYSFIFLLPLIFIKNSISISNYLVIYVLATILTNKVFTNYFNLFSICIALSLLMLITPAAIPLYILCVLYFYLCVFYSKSGTKHPVIKIIMVFVSLIIPIVFYTSNISSINHLIQPETIVKLPYKELKQVINENSIIKGPIKLSFLATTCINFIILSLISFFYRKDISPARIIKLNALLTLGACMCVFIMYKYIDNINTMKVYMSFYSIIVYTMLLIIINKIVDSKK